VPAKGVRYLVRHHACDRLEVCHLSDVDAEGGDPFLDPGEEGESVSLVVLARRVRLEPHVEVARTDVLHQPSGEPVDGREGGGVGLGNETPRRLDDRRGDEGHEASLPDETGQTVEGPLLLFGFGEVLHQSPRGGAPPRTRAFRQRDIT
jgi:hypothetical protein